METSNGHVQVLQDEGKVVREEVRDREELEVVEEEAGTMGCNPTMESEARNTKVTARVLGLSIKPHMELPDKGEGLGIVVCAETKERRASAISAKSTFHVGGAKSC